MFVLRHLAAVVSHGRIRAHCEITDMHLLAVRHGGISEEFSSNWYIRWPSEVIKRYDPFREGIDHSVHHDVRFHGPGKGLA